MRLTVFSFIAIVSIAAADVARSQEVIDGSASNIEASELDALLKSTPEFLKDPTSAQFSKLRKDPTNSDYICGSINAKNAFGGYVGTQYFRYGLGNGMLIMTSTDC